MPVFSKGSRFHDSSSSSHRSWTVLRKVGEGQSAEVYSVRCEEIPSTQFAVKIEREPGIRTLKAELKVLKQLQDSPHACHLVEHGIHQGHDYIVMELLGNNAVELRKLQAPQGRWGTHTVKQMGLPMLAALQEMHGKGLIHRDVKAANFGVSPPGYTISSGNNFEGTLKVIDFGLSKRYTDDQGRIIPRREGRAGFRGSTAYASIYAHEELEQGRRDDLWSWLYVLVEMLDGGLCWRIGKDKADRRAEDASRHLNSKHMDAEKQKKKEIALKRKQAALTDPDLLTANVVLPDALKLISSYLSTLDFADEPDYDRLRADLTSMPDGYPAAKHPQAYGQTSQTSSFAPTPAASPNASHGPIASMPYPPAHPSYGSAPIQYPEAAWGSAQAPYDPGALQPGAAWQQGYASNGHVRDSPREYAGDDRSSWDPAQQQHWHTHVHAQHNGYASAAAIPDTPMSPLEERQGYSPHALPHGPGHSSPYHMPGSVPNGRGPELDEIKRQAQMHLQKSLAGHHHQQYGPSGAWPAARHASPLGGGSAAGHLGNMGPANGHHRSKRGRSAESDPEGGSKRSRLGMSAPALQPAAVNGFEQAQLGQAWVPDDAEGPPGSPADAGVLGVLEMVHQVHSNQVSQEACEAKNQLRTLDAAEGIGVMAWLIDGMLSQRTDPDSHAMVADWVTDLADFAKHRIQMSRT